jgi:hypothetical protein
MPVTQIEDLVTPGADILGTSQDQSGTILAQTGDVLAEDVASDGAEWWQHVGFASRPAKAEAGKAACNGITINRGTHDCVIASRDLRGSGVYGTLGEGETCVYAPGPSNQGTAKVLLQSNGTTEQITISIGGTQILVKSDGSITISGGPVNIAGASDFAALASKVDSNFAALKAAISAATAGGSPVVWTPPATPTVAAAEVKIS